MKNGEHLLEALVLRAEHTSDGILWVVTLGRPLHCEFVISEILGSCCGFILGRTVMFPGL